MSRVQNEVCSSIVVHVEARKAPDYNVRGSNMDSCFDVLTQLQALPCTMRSAALKILMFCSVGRGYGKESMRLTTYSRMTSGS